MDYQRWSEWRKWDLHIHTPKSIVSKYWWDNEEVWDKFIKSLENLPEEVKVIWITDYYFIDWYEKVMSYKQQWRLKNIEKIFPILEFRIDTFWSWNENKLQKINLHILFNLDENDIKEEIKKVKERFIGLIPITKLEKHKTKVLSIDNFISEWWGSLDDGFGSLIPSTDRVFDLIKSQEWSSKTFLFLWYKEWSNLDKNNQLKPFKEDLYCKVGAFFSSNFSKFEDSQKWLNEFWNKKLLHSLDIHDMKTLTIDYFCNTRIKWDPTFEWLKQIFYEWDERVYIWDKPEIFNRIEQNKTQYISNLIIDQVDSYDETRGIWFKNECIDFNTWLVAIIWNKWSWKSAVADILWLLWNSKKEKYFSFLRDDRFRKSKLANNFEWKLNFISWDNITKNLWENIEESSVERIRYLPQNYFNEITEEIENKKFKETLENVVFNHLNDDSKFWKSSFEDLVNFKSIAVKNDIREIYDKIKKLNNEIFNLEKCSQKWEIDKLKSKIELKKQELKVQEDLLKRINKEKPKNYEKRNDDNTKQLEKIKKYEAKISDLDEKIQTKKTELSELKIHKEELNNVKLWLESFERRLIEFVWENIEVFEFHWLDKNKIVKMSVDYEKINKKIWQMDEKINSIECCLMDTNKINDIDDERLKKKIQRINLSLERENLVDMQNKLRTSLSSAEIKYQEYLEMKKNIEQLIKDIKWDINIPDTLMFYEKKLKDLTEKKKWLTVVEKNILEKKDKRYELVEEIFNKKQEILKLYNEFKKPIDNIVDNENFRESQINIKVNLQINKDFEQNFLQFINQSRRWSFMWKEDWKKELNNIISETEMSFEGIKNMLNSILEHLIFDMRYNDKKENNIFDQINDVEWFYNYIFSLDYIDINYELKSWDKTLDQLSPWEKWNLLLIFYLMIDKETIPLVIDQPEDNLDNKSVFEMLSVFIKQAKKRRQIILVTHNPNLAIWADAEQIICTTIDKTNLNKFSYISWSIENPYINDKIVEILEWTMPAFQKRELKYQKR